MTRSATDRPPLDAQEIWALICAGEDSAILAVFEGRSERERRAVAPELVRRHGEMEAGSWNAPTVIPYVCRDTMCAAFFACWSLSEIKKLKREHQFGNMCTGTTVAVLIERQPSWTTAWAEWALERQARPSGRAPGLWVLVRKLILAGVCAPLDSESYILGMEFGCNSPFFDYRNRWHAGESWGIAGDRVAMDRHLERARSRTILDCLEEDPALIDTEIWRIFEVPGRPSRQLTAAPSTTEAPVAKRDLGWIEAFVTLAERGRIDRERVLRSALAALSGDLRAQNAAWFMALWSSMGPTSAERSRAQSALIDLVAKPTPAVVQFALRELVQLQSDGGLSGDLFVRQADAALITMPVATVRDVLRLLDLIASDQPDLAGQAMVATAAALLHSNPRARSEAIRILRRHVRSLTRSAVSLLADNARGLPHAEQARVLALTATTP